MADNTDIEWTDATWNPITGCSVVSPGCTNCYAMRLAGTRLRNTSSRVGLTRDTNAGPVWNGEVRFNEQWLEQPLHWRRARRIFVCAHGDLFHESVPDAWIDRVWDVMEACCDVEWRGDKRGWEYRPRHTFQVLTKRALRMRTYVAARLAKKAAYASQFDHCPTLEMRNSPAARAARDDAAVVRSHIWLGVSVEDQRRADERVPVLLDIRAAVRWLSCEPLLGRVDLCELLGMWWNSTMRCFESVGQRFNTRGVDGTSGIDWVVAGGESGPGARPMHPQWATSLRDQCIAAGVPFFFKQWGAFAPGVHGPNWDAVPNDPHLRIDDPRLDVAQVTNVGKKAAGRTLDGRTWDEYPRAVA